MKELHKKYNTIKLLKIKDRELKQKKQSKNENQYKAKNKLEKIIENNNKKNTKIFYKIIKTIKKIKK